MRTRLVPALLVLTLGFTFAACGDDGGGDDVTLEEVGDGGDNGGGDGDGGSDATVGDIDSPFLSGDCEDVIQAIANAGAAQAAAFTGQAGDLDEAAGFFDEIADAAPDEIAADFAVFAEAYAEFAQVLADADVDFTSGETPDPEAIAALTEAGEVFNTPEFQEASANINTFMEETCEVPGG